MPPGRFDALRDDDDSSDGGERDESVTLANHRGHQQPFIPSYEDLSASRADEETVLAAVYGDDFTRENGARGVARLNVHCRPPDVDRVGCELTLSVQLDERYPYAVPSIDFRNVKGLSSKEQAELLDLLNTRAHECVTSGSVMMIELVQIVEEFLVAYNHDPNMSAWEQMKAREAQEKEERLREGQEREEAMRKLIFSESVTGDPEESPSGLKQIHATGGEVEKELARQVEALRKAGRKRRPSDNHDGVPPTVDADVEDDDGSDEFDEDEDEAPITGSSRYQTDFVELGLLGRGGGGEVVKVRNRLDRRIYAVKKIILESEQGKYAKLGALQNRKLRREVTTISRITHKNIVRYYQAWVEGGENTSQGGAMKREESRKTDDDSESSSSDDESKGWWESSPLVNGVLTGRIRKGETVELIESISEAWNTPGNEASYSDPSSKNDDIIHDFRNPLMIGMGFKDEIYDGLINRRDASRPKLSEDEDMWDDSSVKVDASLGQRILYIQMEYCSTTLRKVIDKANENPFDETEKFRMIRQIVEALVYLHGQNLIHRDLVSPQKVSSLQYLIKVFSFHGQKPGNVFLDAERNIRLGDFGLATRHSAKLGVRGIDDEKSSEISTIYNAIEDITSLLGGSLQDSAVSADSQASTAESLTGGVGTTFYRAPEQEGGKVRGASDRSYDVQADIFSLGIVLFEMFHPPFVTYMERAEILNRLRGESLSNDSRIFNPRDATFDWDKLADDRFPKSFVDSTPKSAQKLILWCLQRDPTKRPTAAQILNSDLLPRKMELEQHYLEEALHTLANPQSESYLQILGALFARTTSDLLEITFDGDIAAKANNLGSSISSTDGGRKLSLSEGIVKAIGNIRNTGSLDTDYLRSVAMSSSSLIAATAALLRAKESGNTSKGVKGIMKRASQRVAGIIAMNAATSAAVTGLTDGVHGADPRVIDHVCSELKAIFEAHGAVHLRSPLLRPKPSFASSVSTGGLAEVMNSRGTVLVLPEDLTASFARAVGRGGTATSNIKRYDISRAYHKSLVGGHPRESLEASFDITHEHLSTNSTNVEAECILVLCNAITIVAPNRKEKIASPLMDSSPIWYLRLTHTRLADSILDVCGVPPREALRRRCFQMFTHFTAPNTKTALEANRLVKSRSRSRSEGSYGEAERTQVDLLEQQFASLIENGLPRGAAQRFHLVLSSGCCPLPTNLDDAVDVLIHAVGNLRVLDSNSNLDSRRLKRYDDIGRSAKHLKNLSKVLNLIGVSPHLNRRQHGGHDIPENRQYPSISRPLYICLDLGLRERRQSFNLLYFQALLIPPSAFHVSERARVGEYDVGIKVAEGGRYDDLVRTYRPPGNFGSTLLNFYTNASIPVCVGVRFSVGRLVESLYIESSLSLSMASADVDASSKFVSDSASIDILRKSLGHPLKFASSVQVIVASANGLDAGSTRERLIVASHLWANGVSAEYLAHSGVIMSLLHPRSRDESTSSDWSLEELCAVCAIMNIPYVVVVQPHLLRDKGSVRLRRIQFDPQPTGSNPGNSEMFVALHSLASTVLAGSSDDTEHSFEGNDDVNTFDVAAGSGQIKSSGKAPRIECVFVEGDQFFGSDKQIMKSDYQNWKSILKILKTVSQRSEAYLETILDSSSSQGTVVIATDLPFWVIREFGTSLMRKSGESTSAMASAEIIERYPKHKRVLKTLSMAIDATMKKRGFWNNNMSSSNPKGGGSSQVLSRDMLTLFLYSRLDDRFDMISLGDDGGSAGMEAHRGGNDVTGRNRRNDRKKG